MKTNISLPEFVHPCFGYFTSDPEVDVEFSNSHVLILSHHPVVLEDDDAVAGLGGVVAVDVVRNEEVDVDRLRSCQLRTPPHVGFEHGKNLQTFHSVSQRIPRS